MAKNLNKKRPINEWHKPYIPKYDEGGFSHLTEDYINSAGSKKRKSWSSSIYKYESLAEMTAREQQKEEGRKLKLVNQPHNPSINKDKN